jgi:hypothetical protein
MASRRKQLDVQVLREVKKFGNHCKVILYSCMKRFKILALLFDFVVRIAASAAGDIRSHYVISRQKSIERCDWRK